MLAEAGKMPKTFSLEEKWVLCGLMTDWGLSSFSNQVESLLNLTCFAGQNNLNWSSKQVVFTSEITCFPRGPFQFVNEGGKVGARRQYYCFSISLVLLF